ncbi:paeninodin family lasso peptide [Paenibacillus sp. Soil522]|nr:paeninodin family lasso peptide [Paenibacillus sp. Soil522]
MKKEMMKEWQQPMLQVLDVSETMGGKNGVYPDRNGKGNNNGQPHEDMDS